MTEQLYYIDKNNNILNLYNESPYGFEGEQGMGNTGLELQTQSYPFEDGGYYLGNKAGEREFQLGIGIHGCTTGLLQQYRRELFQRLSRRYAPGSIRRIPQEGITRQIDCWLVGGPDGSSAELLGPPSAVVMLTFRAPWPYYYDPNEVNLSTCDFASCSGTSVNNEGDVYTWPVITFSNMSNLVNPRLDLGDKYIEFDYTFASGTLVLDTTMGHKTCWLNGSTAVSYLGYITPGSQIFALEPGVNIIVFSCDSGDADISITWTEWYEVL